MLFNWDVENVCIVFEWWRIKSPFGLLLSCFIIAGIAAGYEFLRHASREYDDELIAANKKKDASRRLEDEHAENDGLLSTSTSALTRYGSEKNRGRGSDTQSEIADPLSACYLHILTMTLLLHRRMSQQQKVTRSIIYAVLVGISFWLMLVFMTYNGFLMISVVIGAGLGHYAFGGNLPTDRGIQCH
jgi:copper transporter 1